MSEDTADCCCQDAPEQGAPVPAPGHHSGPCPDKKPKFREHPAAVSTAFTWTSGDAQIAYTATAGHIDIREDCGQPIGSFFCLSYVADAPEGCESAPGQVNPRPVTFAFNGGPGSASVPINVGGIGPRRVVPNGDRRIGPSPVQIEDNPYTLLTESDLVFVDALGTGWSDLAEGVKPERAWGVDKDAECFARLIYAWLEKTGRWNSPIYLYGESYGTTRNAVLCRVLEEMGIACNGVVLLSAILDWTPTIPGNDANYVQLFPTFASIANYHGKCDAAKGKTDDELFEAACAFAEDKLAPALLKGDRLSKGEETELAGEMSDFLGLSKKYLRRKHLRVELTDFRYELLADEGRVCGRLDGRYTVEGGNFLQTSREGTDEEDPASSGMSAAWDAGWHHIVGSEIGYHNDRPYLPSNYEKIGPKWDHKHRSAGAQWSANTPNVTYDIAYTMRHNPAMKVLVLGGRYDLATPFLGPIEDFARMYLSDEAKKNLSFKLYDAGHMIYVNTDAFEKLAADVAEFYRA